MKKLLAVGVIVLFLGVSVIPSTGTTDVKQIAMPTSSGNTLYVGGSGTGNYTRIQDAIDDASDGDTVFVYAYSSPYYENIVVDKTINLFGENKDTTIIDGSGSGDVVYVTADYTNISRFTIFGGIKVKANFTIISENIIITIQGECIYIGGIWENNSYFNNTIVDNILRSNSNAITIEKSHFNYISGNKVDAGGPYNHGILLVDSKYSIVSGNIIGDCIFGIPILNGTNNIITENIISSSVSGVLLWGEPDSRCSFNTISRNNIRSNNFSILLDGVSMNNIFENNFYSNSSSAYFWGSLGSLNKWSRNYWNRPRLFPKIIFGQITIGSKWIPWINFDWHPAKEPYDIGV